MRVGRSRGLGAAGAHDVRGSIGSCPLLLPELAGSEAGAERVRSQWNTAMAAERTERAIPGRRTELHIVVSEADFRRVTWISQCLLFLPWCLFIGA